MSAISRLNDDVLSKIFLLAVPIEQFLPYTSDAPKNVAQVNRAWRRIALSTPQLWSVLPIYFAFLYGIPVEEEYPIHIRLWLERSRSFPLRCEFIEDQDGPETNGLFELFLERQHQWKSMEIRWWRDRPDVRRFMVHDLRRLEHLMLSYYKITNCSPPSFREDPVSPSLLDTLKTVLDFPPIHHPKDVIAPKLTSLILRNIRGFPHTPRELFLPILRHAPNLESLEIDFKLGFYKKEVDADVTDWVNFHEIAVGNDAVRESDVVLPRLHSLVCLIWDGVYTNFLAHLRVPNLKQLDFAGVGWHPAHRGRVPDLYEMLNKSSAQVETGKFSIHLDGWGWAQLWGALPALKSLELPGGCALEQAQVLKLFYPPKWTSGPYPLPELSYLRFDVLYIFKRVLTGEEEDADYVYAVDMQSAERLFKNYYEGGGKMTVDLPILKVKEERNHKTVTDIQDGLTYNLKELVMNNEYIRQKIEEGAIKLSAAYYG